MRPRSQRRGVAVTDSDRNLQKTDLLHAWEDSGGRPSAKYLARRSIAETKTDSKTFCWRSDHDPKYRTIRYCQYFLKSQAFTYLQEWHSSIAFQPPAENQKERVAQLTGFTKSSPRAAQNVGKRVNVELDHGRTCSRVPPLLKKRGKPDADVLQSSDYLKQIIEPINS